MALTRTKPTEYRQGQAKYNNSRYMASGKLTGAFIGGCAMSNKTHYIGMAGLHGCLPQTCEVYESYLDAVQSLALIHDLGKNRTRELKKNGYLELNLHRDGNEYCEIEECNCDTPEIHSDSM